LRRKLLVKDEIACLQQSHGATTPAIGKAEAESCESNGQAQVK